MGPVGATRNPGFDAARLRAARQDAGLDRGTLAVRVGVSYVTIVGYEHARHVPPAPVLVRLAHVLGIRPGQLLATAQEHWSLADYRIVAGLLQKDAAAALKITPDRLSRVETGVDQLDDEAWERVAALYGRDCQELQASWSRTRRQLLGDL